MCIRDRLCSPGYLWIQKRVFRKIFNHKSIISGKVEKLEQLRVLENGYKIKMIESKYKSIGIDTLEDYNEAVKFLNLKL